MEVHHERLSSLAALDLIAVRSGGEPASGSQFLNCLKPVASAPVAPPAESRSSATDAEPTSTVIEDTDAELEQDEPADEEPAAEGSATPPTSPIAQTQRVVDSVDEIGIEGDIAAPSVEPTTIDVAGESLASPPGASDATTATSASDEAIVSAIPIAADMELTAIAAGKVEQQADATKSSAKSKRSKVTPADGEVNPEEPSQGTNDKPQVKPKVPATQTPENTTVLGPPEVAPLDVAKSEDAGSSSGGKESNAVVTEQRQLPAPAETAAPAQAADTSVATTQASTDAVATVDISKPPAAFLKARAAGDETARAAGEIDSAKFMSRVVKAFESAHQRGSEVRLRLHPVELGALSIEVRIYDSVLTANVQAETPEAKAAIIDNLPALRERLADQGIRIDKFDVDLMDHSDRRQQSLDEQARQQESRQAAASRSTTRRVVSADATPTTTPRNRASGQGGLNVVI